MSQTAHLRSANREDCLITACRTACLYGVSYSLTSPTYPDDDIFYHAIIFLNEKSRIIFNVKVAFFFFRLKLFYIFVEM